MPKKRIIARAEVLQGLGGRTTKQASTLLVLIEQRTAHLVAQAQTVANSALAVAATPTPRHAFFQALAAGRADLPPPTIQEIAHFAPHWALLVPANPEMRAAVAYLLGQKYVLPANAAPISDVLGLATPAVQAAYQRLYNQPLSTVFAPQLTRQQRLHWRWAAFSAYLETLPPFWLTFFLTLPAVSGLLALPIALASLGPLWGVGVILFFGVVNMLTAAALAETVVRSGTARFGLGFLGQLTQEYLGSAATSLLTVALLLSNFLVLIIFFLGVGGTLADATGWPAPLWMLLLFAVTFYFLSRRSLNATVTMNLLIVFVNLAIVLAILLLTLPYFDLRNLGGSGASAFTPAAVGSIGGILSATFLSHYQVATYGPVILPRDPQGRSWLWGSVAAIAVMAVIACLWLLIISGALPSATLRNAAGTVVIPLAQRVGPAVTLLGSLLVILSLGLATIQVALAQYYAVEEWLPKRGAGTWAGQLGDTPRLWLANSPMLLVLGLAIWLLRSGVGSFAGLLGTVNVLALPLLTGIIPLLLLVATRHKGDFVPGFGVHWLGHPVLVGLLILFFVAGIMSHGLYIWDAWPLRLVGMGGGLVILLVVLWTWRRGLTTARMVLTLRQDERLHGRSHYLLVANGHPLAAPLTLHYHDGQSQQAHSADAAIVPFNALERVLVAIPAAAALTLKGWLHRVSPAGESSGIPAQVILTGAGQATPVSITTKAAQGHFTLPLHGDICQVEIQLEPPKHG